MQKPNKNAPAIEHLVYGMCQIADERQESCIHCGQIWYSIHYRDGVCHACQQKQLPGRTELREQDSADRMNTVVLYILFVFFLISILLLGSIILYRFVQG